jgi:hypothetical protein
MVEYPEDVSVGEDAKLDVEHRVNACESEEKTSEWDVAKITGRSCGAFMRDEWKKSKQTRGSFENNSIIFHGAHARPFMQNWSKGPRSTMK